MNLKNKKVLVTGADGFIGSHLTEELVRQGANVRAFVFYNSFNSWGWLDHSPKDIRDSIEVFTGDIRDPYGVNCAVAGVNVVFHLAALISIPFSYHSPDAFIDTNVKGTLNVLHAVKAHQVEKMVHTSTSEVYGTAKFVPITEEHPLQGQSPYSASKIGADQMAFSFYSSFQTPVAILRPFNTFGPRQSARAIIPTIVTQIANGRRRIELGALHPTRDFTFIDDTVSAFIATAASAKTVGQTTNCGSNFEISIGNLVELIGKVMNVKVDVARDKNRIRPKKSEVERLWAENKKLKAITSWKPKYYGVKGFERALKKTIQWYLQPNNLAKYKESIYNI